MDSLANRQHSCRGSEELAIRKTARFQATPSYFAGLRATPSGGRPRTPSYSEQLRAALSHSELRIGSIKLPRNRRKLDTVELRAAPNPTWGRPRTPSYSELLRAALSHSELRIGSTKLPGNRRNLGTPNLLYSEHSKLLRATPNNSELLRATPSGGRPRTPSYSELIPETPSCEPRACRLQNCKLF